MNETFYQLKETFLQEWPLSRIQNMTLEEYTNLDKTSFCYWMEAKTHDLGSIWGGSSYKFGIYKRRDISTTITVDNRITDGEYAWFQKYGTTKEAAFQTVKNTIVSIIQNAQNNTLENIDAIDLGDAYKWKIAFLYGNFNVVNIFKNESLLEAAQSLGYNEASKSYSDLNHFILSNKPSEQDYFDFTAELWKKTTLANAIKYWLYAPGENASKWEEFYSEGIMGLGWDQLGDLDQYTSKKDIKKKLQELEGVESSKQNDTAANFEFHKVIKQGDIVIVKKGISELLGYGVVTSDYFYDENRASYQKCRKLDWKLKGSWKVDFNLPVKTLTDVTKYPTEDPSYSKYYERLLAIMEGKGFNSSYKLGYSNYLTTIYGENSGTKTSYVKAIEILSKLLNYNIFEVNDLLQLQQLYADLIKEQRNTEGKYFHPEAPSYGQNGFYSASIKTYIDFHKQLKDNSMNSSTYKAPLNQILYGPPGTGKTYNTVLEAAKIVTGNETINYDEALQVFNENLNNQIEFITFHQNYSYEDFIQGLRPDITQNNHLSFERTDGVFMQIAVNALFEFYKAFQSRDNIFKLKKIDVNEVYIDFFKSLKLNQEFKTKTNKTIYIDSFTKNQNIIFKYSEASKPATVSSERLLKLFNVFKSIEEINNINEDIRNVIGGCDATVYYTSLREFIDFYNKYKENLKEFGYVEDDYVEEDYTELNYDDVSYERKKELLSKISFNDLKSVEINDVKKYVIIIDEINRANISRVFGELITLIEEDKRSHGKIPMRVTLPSGDSFIVPSNLYIIGTMNTADKSISLLDIALRRRFEFNAKYPKYDGLEKPIHHAQILKKINERIINLKGPDFQIGHAYFMDNDNLIEIMNKKVIPLLLEYFMNDGKQVKEILNVEGYSVDETSWPIEFIKN